MESWTLVDGTIMPFLQEHSKLIITDDFEEQIALLKDEVKAQPSARLYIYPKENILLDDVKKIIRHAFLKVDYTQYIVLPVLSIGQESQNALLKLLEEPPSNNFFLLLAPSKNIFLPTILSRLILVKSILTTPEKEALPQGFEDMSSLQLMTIFSYIQEQKHISKVEAKAFLERVFEQIVEQNLLLDEAMLETFSQSMRLLEVGSKPIVVVSHLLLQLQRHGSK